jgi:hypothetical protein
LRIIPPGKSILARSWDCGKEFTLRLAVKVAADCNLLQGGSYFWAKRLMTFERKAAILTQTIVRLREYCRVNGPQLPHLKSLSMAQIGGNEGAKAREK